MILGVFWCQRDKLWLRFSENDVGKEKIISAEIAKTSPNQNTTQAWQPISKGSWPTSYVYGSAEPLPSFYAFDNGMLYKTDGSLTGLNTLLASIRKGGNWNTHNVVRFNPFPEEMKDSSEISSYNALPLTPEMLVEKEKMEQEALKLKKEQDVAKWKKYQTSGVLSRDTELVSMFAKPTQDLLLECLKTELFDLDVKNYSCEAYLDILKTIIEDDSNSSHQKIISLAAKTDLDRMIDVHLHQKELFKEKKAFLFNRLREEATYLANEFSIKCTILDDQEIAQKQSAEKILSKQIERNHQEIYFNDDWILDDPYQVNPIEHNVDAELQRAMEVSMQDQNDVQNIQLEEEEINLQQVLNLSLQNQKNDNETNALISIKTAVSSAQEAYEQWYKGDTNLRGPNGYFTFFRHGHNGQIRAADLNNRIIITQDINSAIAEVNAFLCSDATKYNRHSFASFLLDELKQLGNTTWNEITYVGDSNLYDKNMVIEHLVPQNRKVNH